jgi:hypothetical protein
MDVAPIAFPPTLRAADRRWITVDIPPASEHQFQRLLEDANVIGYTYTPIAVDLSSYNHQSTLHNIPTESHVVPPAIDTPRSLTDTDTTTSGAAPAVAVEARQSQPPPVSGPLNPQITKYLQETIPSSYNNYCKLLVFPNQAVNGTFAQVIFGWLVEEVCKCLDPPIRYGSKVNAALKVPQTSGPDISMNDVVMYLGNITPKTFSNYKTIHMKALTTLTKLPLCDQHFLLNL